VKNKMINFIYWSLFWKFVNYKIALSFRSNEST